MIASFYPIRSTSDPAVRGPGPDRRSRDVRPQSHPLGRRGNPRRASRSHAASSRRQFLEFCGSLAAVLGLNSLDGPPAGAGPRVGAAAERRLDPAPGMHRLRRERAPHRRADDRQPGAGSDLAGLLAHAHGRGRGRGRAGAAGLDAGQRRQVSPGGDRLDPARRRTGSTRRSAAGPRRRFWRRRRRAPPR